MLTKNVLARHRELTRNGPVNRLQLPQPTPSRRIPRHQGGCISQMFRDSDIGRAIDAAPSALTTAASRLCKPR